MNEGEKRNGMPSSRFNIHKENKTAIKDDDVGNLSVSSLCR